MLNILFREYYDLMNGLLVLQYLMERQRIPIFESVSIALNCTSKVINRWRVKASNCNYFSAYQISTLVQIWLRRRFCAKRLTCKICIPKMALDRLKFHSVKMEWTRCKTFSISVYTRLCESRVVLNVQF